MRALVAFNLWGWIEENRATFEPPVGNKVIWEDSQFIAMVVRGPNARRCCSPYAELGRSPTQGSSVEGGAGFMKHPEVSPSTRVQGTTRPRHTQTLRRRVGRPW